MAQERPGSPSPMGRSQECSAPVLRSHRSPKGAPAVAVRRQRAARANDFAIAPRTLLRSPAWDHLDVSAAAPKEELVASNRRPS
eukprot:5889375-Alexandrium_andersonii.AAC.1